MEKENIVDEDVSVFSNDDTKDIKKLANQINYLQSEEVEDPKESFNKSENGDAEDQVGQSIFDTQLENMGGQNSSSDNNKFNKRKNKKYQIIIVVLIIAISVVATLITVKVYSAISPSKKIYTSNSYVEDEEQVKDNINKISSTNKEILNIEENKNNDKSDEIKDLIKQENEKKNISPVYEEYEKLTDEEKNDSEVIPDKEVVPIDKLDDIKDDNKETEIPRKYNLKDKIKIDFEDQGAFGLCWDFAATKSFETNYQLKTNKKLDLSEIHVDYITSDKMFGNREIHSGGNFGFYNDYLLTFSPAKGLDYRDYDKNEYSSFADKGEDVYVTDTITFPTITKNPNDNIEYTDEQLQEFRKLVKTHIMTNGSLYAAIHASMNTYIYDPYYMEDAYIDHAVSIIGWDDDYPKEKMPASDGSIPKENGAYIALNSWGENPMTGSPYYYISYEDRNVETNLSGVLSTSLDDTYDLNKLENKKLKKYILDLYGKYVIEKDGKKLFSKNAFKSIYSLSLKDKDITNEDLDFISKFENLYYLDLSNNNITDVSKLSSLSLLASLVLDNNKNVKNYSQLESLVELSLKDCNLDSLENLSNSKINIINLSNNNITNIVDLLPSTLVSIEIDNNNIADLYQFNSYTMLVSISAVNNNIAGIENLDNLTSLSILDLSKNKEINLENLSNIQIGSSLYGSSGIMLSDCNIEDISVINNMNVSYIDLSDNNIVDTSNFNNSNVKELLLDNNPLQNVNSLGNMNFLSLDKTGLTEEKLVGLNNIYFLSLEDNDIKNIEFLDINSNIKTIDLTNNKVESLSGLKENNSLTSIDLDNNGLKDLSGIENLSELNSLSLANNPIEDMSVFKDNNKIETLNLDGIDYSKIVLPESVNYVSLVNCNIKNLNLDNNKLYYVDVSKNKDLSDYTFIKDMNEYASIITDREFTQDEVSRVSSLDSKSYISGASVLYKKTLSNDLIDLTKDWNLRKLVGSVFFYNSENSNGYITRNVKSIKIHNKSENYYQFDAYHINNFSSLKVKVVF